MVEGRVWGFPLVGKMVATICIRKNCLNAEVHATRKYSRTPLFRSPKGNGKKFEIAGLRNNRGSVKGKGKSKSIRSSFEIEGTSN